MDSGTREGPYSDPTLTVPAHLQLAETNQVPPNFLSWVTLALFGFRSNSNSHFLFWLAQVAPHRCAVPFPVHPPRRHGPASPEGCPVYLCTPEAKSPSLLPVWTNREEQRGEGEAHLHEDAKQRKALGKALGKGLRHRSDVAVDAPTRPCLESSSFFFRSGPVLRDLQAPYPTSTSLSVEPGQLRSKRKTEYNNTTHPPTKIK